VNASPGERDGLFLPRGLAEIFTSMPPPRMRPHRFWLGRKDHGRTLAGGLLVLEWRAEFTSVEDAWRSRLPNHATGAGLTLRRSLRNVRRPKSCSYD
jgi:hypothetical protein